MQNAFLQLKYKMPESWGLRAFNAENPIAAL